MGKFLSKFALNAAKHAHDVFNSRVKRGEIDPTTYVRTQFVVCECGVEGCGFITRWMKNQSNVVDYEEEFKRYHEALKNGQSNLIE